MTSSISGLMTAAGDIVSESTSWVGTAASTITSNSIILLAVLVPFVGLGIGLLKRLIRTRA